MGDLTFVKSFLHDESEQKIFSLSPVPGPVGNLSASSTLSKIYLSWHAPILPNGVIIAYEVSYRPADNSGHEISLNTTDLESSFTEGNDAGERDWLYLLCQSIH